MTAQSGTGFGGTNVAFPFATGTIQGAVPPISAVVALDSDGNPVLVADPATGAFRVFLSGGGSVVSLQDENTPYVLKGFPLHLKWDDSGTLITTQGNAGAIRMSRDGLLHTIGAPRSNIIQRRITLTSTGAVTLLFAAGAGVFQDISYIDASANFVPAAPLTVDLRSIPGGAVEHSLDLFTATNKPFGDDPWLQTAANQDWTATLSQGGPLSGSNRIALHVKAQKRVS